MPFEINQICGLTSAKVDGANAAIVGFTAKSWSIYDVECPNHEQIEQDKG